MTFGGDTKKKSIRWNLLTFWEAGEAARPWIRFSPHNKTIRKHWEQKMIVCVVNWGRARANQCAMNQSSIRGEMPPGDNRTESHTWQMIFICNIMDYKCHDELIIMLLFTIMKQGQSMTHLCLLKVLLFVLGRVMQEVKCGPVVIRWSQRNSQGSAYCPLIYSLIKKLENNKIGTN